MAAKPSGFETAERRITVTPVSRGVGIGQIVFFPQDIRRIHRTEIGAHEVDREIARLADAVTTTKSKINSLAREQNRTGTVFGAHLVMMDKSSFILEIEDVIRERRVSAEWAARLVAEHKRKLQHSIADERFREKAADIVDVAERIIDELTGSSQEDWAAPPESVIVARELRPSNIVMIAKSFPSAIVTERGGWTSHASILARDMKIPMVSGAQDIEAIFSEHDNAIVDAVKGQVIVDPDIETIERFRTIAMERRVPDDHLNSPRNFTVTRDGVEIVIRANAETPAAYEAARAAGGEGIGLFRSEALVQDPGALPSEEEQFRSYTAIAEAVGEDGVKIRTFDIGIGQFRPERTEPENNPSLGLKSIRLCLANEDFFRVQIRALLRASAEYPQIDIILPMITGVDEIDRTRELLESERRALADKGVAAGEPQLGIMIEVPSAVLTADEIAENVDFLCLGTNDLVQYLLAVDRDNELVEKMYQTLHPAVFRAVKQVISAAGRAGKKVIVCGEMAGSPFYVPLLLGAGARELSMNVTSIQNVRRLISGITTEDAAGLLQQVVECKTADAAEELLRRYYQEYWSDLFPPDLLDAKHR